MSSSVRVMGRGRAARLFGVAAVLTLASGGSIAALLTVATAATGGLVAAAAHRPGALDRWAPPVAAPALAARGEEAVWIFAEHDARFAPGGADFADGLSALGARIVEARLALDDAPSAARSAALQPMTEEDRDDPALPASADTASPRSEVAALGLREISPDAPVAMASAVSPAPPMRLASLEEPARALVSPALDPAPSPEREASSESEPVAEPARVPPLPRPRPGDFARTAPRESALSRVAAVPVRAEAPAPRPMALAYAAPELDGGARSDGPNDFFRNLLGQGAGVKLPGRRAGIAVYDIASATVRLPNGEKLEAHSGLGHRQDNPAYVREKNRGPTPPNVYDLRMREALFHGAEAIRLLPRDQRKVFNRDGLLAHPYMYVGGGDRSQSNGCVVFKNYGRFLRAYKAGEIAKLVVVPNMAALPTYMAGL